MYNDCNNATREFLACMQGLRRAIAPIEGVVPSLLGAVVGGRVGRQCLDDVRRAEGALHGYLTRGLAS